MPKRKIKYYKKIEISVPITKKEFLRQRTADFGKDHISKVYIVKNKILKASEVDSLVNKGGLKKIKYKGKLYFSKQQIAGILKNQKMRLKHFQI